MRSSFFSVLLFAGIWVGWGRSSTAEAYTANKVWFEFLPTGKYRVHVSYTIPELKEFRESYVEFRKKTEAEAYYWDLLRGVDFYLPLATDRRSLNPPMKPEPW